MFPISVTRDVSKLLKSNNVRFLHELNIWNMLVTCEVSKLLTSKFIKLEQL